MLTIDGTDLACTQGDSIRLTLNFSGRELPANTRAVLTVRRHAHSDTALLTKTVTVADGKADFLISSEENGFDVGGVWDVRLLLPCDEAALGTTEVITPMECGVWTVLPAVGNP